MARGLNENLVVVLHHILWNMGERISVGDEVGLIRRRF
jgi:hypothetical protein